MWINGSTELNLVFAEMHTKEMLERAAHERRLPSKPFRVSLAAMLRRAADRLAPSTGGLGLSPAAERAC